MDEVSQTLSIKILGGAVGEGGGVGVGESSAVLYPWQHKD